MVVTEVNVMITDSVDFAGKWGIGDCLWLWVPIVYVASYNSSDYCVIAVRGDTVLLSCDMLSKTLDRQTDRLELD